MSEESSSGKYEAPAILAEDVIIFPHSEVTITARDRRNTTALLQSVKERQLIVVMPSYNSKDATGSIGTLALVRKTALVEGGVKASVKGLWRVRVEKVLEETAYARVRFTKAEEIDDASTGNSGTMEVVLDQIDEFAKLIPGIPTEITEALRSAETPGRLADLCANSPGFSSEERLDLLKTLGAEERLEKVSRHFGRQLTALRELVKAKTIPECETCAELADRVIESEPSRSGEIALELLVHVVQEHPDELLRLIAEKYGPTFMRRRALK
ncbi:MAG: LON peptidase substrate-binding domain-containing protein [Nitrososphaerales archaeon]